MIPTMFGITILSFCVMQLAPGDPLLQQFDASGGQQGQTPDAFLIQMRDLKLDRPLLVNLRHYYDYKQDVRVGAYVFGCSVDELEAYLATIANNEESPEGAPSHKEFLRFESLIDVNEFEKDLSDEDRRTVLAKKVHAHAQSYFQKQGDFAVADAMEILNNEDLSAAETVGLVKVINMMVVEAGKPTYSTPPDESETNKVQSVWQLWWDREQDNFKELSGSRLTYLNNKWTSILENEEADPFKRFAGIRKDDVAYFIEILFDETKPLEERAMATAVLNLLAPRPLKLTLSPKDEEEKVQRVKENWATIYELEKPKYEPSAAGKLYTVLGDTQYAHMLWRLVTFQFGKSALKTKEPVTEKIWDAFIVSAPLMLMSQLVIYFVAVPLGITCAVNRENPIDKGISLTVFLLYSVPGFIAGLFFLLFFCYGTYLDWFPMQRLHSQGAEDFGAVRYFLDYLWHCVGPVVCLSLFSLAAIVMYTRTSMLDVIGQDYIRTARAKGVPTSLVIYKHAFRNSLIPILTLFSNILPAMLGGSVLIEVLFGIPGMGKLGWESIESKDIPTLMALIYVQAILVLVSILITDLLYVLVDPRISFGEES